MTIKDQINRNIDLSDNPRRIISLVPSISELLIDLGVGDRLVGRTIFCVLPESITSSNSRIVGGTKSVHFDRIHELQPDLIICNKEENTVEMVEELEKSYPVYVSNIQTIHSALDMITDVGLMTNLKEETDKLIERIESSREAWHNKSLKTRKVIYLIWKKPWMSIGRDTFIFHMLEEAKFESVVYDLRYPTLELSEMEKSSADLLFLSSEPFPFKEKDIQELSNQIGKTQPVLVDGTYFSWYGSRMATAYQYFEDLHRILGETQ
jgi:ABC-type Fe3+-hydroxamate transport system substrate-binding protein